MIKSSTYKNFLDNSLQQHDFADILKEPVAIIGHSRLVTDGTSEHADNNQPVVKDGIVGVHNGIIVNHAQLWDKYKNLNRTYEVDTEIALSLLRHFISISGDIVSAVQKMFFEIEGAASVAFLFNNSNTVLLGTNTGSLYTYNSKNNNLFIFASESIILENILKRNLGKCLPEDEISQVKPGNALLIDFETLLVQHFSLKTPAVMEKSFKTENQSVSITDLSSKEVAATPHIINKNLNFQKYDKKYDEFEASIKQLKRCKVTILPETFPFIAFDESGVSNYVTEYKKLIFSGEDALRNAVSPYRRKGGKPDCIVGFSGGRDSCYALHYIKNILEMNPIAFSYDWGMLTDLGRRNQSRMCGKLGVEHILISADIPNKREYIRKNVLAWLKKPDLGTIPLFMAGDKQYFYYANRLMKEYDIKLLFMAENRLERTHFKHGFCGVKHHDSHKPAYNMDLKDKLTLANYYLKEYITNPSYINASLLDTIGAYISFYMIPHNYNYFFNYITWDERKIEDVLVNEYNWELASDTKSSWRIGDGTAPLYNYIYYTAAGFTENDTFRSNQILEGMIARDEALKLAERDNKPRWDSLVWYCNTIGLDFIKTVETINAMPKLYPMSV